MKKQIFIFLCILAVSCNSKISDSTENTIIPKPLSIEQFEDYYSLEKIDLYIDTTNNVSSDFLTEIIEEKIGRHVGFCIKTTTKGRANIRFIYNSSFVPEEYNLVIDQDGITINASTYGGHFYALQTLLQLFPKEIKSKDKIEDFEWRLPYTQISDKPRFSWRGMMLDVSRHWFTKEEVMAFIDEISEYKMNIFHWHLTDDQGWRIQIDSYPKLMSIGSKRAPRVGKWWTRERQGKDEKATYGGYYTKDDIKEIITFANKRNVSVLPEVDVPGHSMAALVSYPELACLKAPQTVNVGNIFYGEDENSLCAGNEQTYKFLDAVFKEVSEMFPFDYVHIGGDECYKGFWAKCPKCKKKMSDEHISNTEELQSYFIKRTEKILDKYGKKIIGWDEILEGGLAENATVMSWRGVQGGITATELGHEVIMTPTQHCYLDLYQGERSVEPDTYSMLRLRDCYSFNPVSKGIADKSLVLGGQGNLWTESVPTFRHAEYMMWPRGWALAEVLWSSEDNLNWENFIYRVEEHFKRAEFADINYSGNSLYNAIVRSYYDDQKQLNIELSSELENITLYYTFDNTNPDMHSSVYSSPLLAPKNATWLKIQSYINNKKVGNMITLTIDELKSRAK